MFQRRTVALLSVAAGAALELGIHALTGRSEAWDSAQYWTIGLPAVALAAMGIGFLSRGAAWAWTAAIVPSQVLTMMVRKGELGWNLWPLTLILSSILSAPFLLTAFIGSRFRSTR